MVTVAVVVLTLSASWTLFGLDQPTHVGAGVTVVSRKLEQSAERDENGRRPGRVPVTALLQLFPWQAPRASIKARPCRPTALRSEISERTTASLIVAAKLDTEEPKGFYAPGGIDERKQCLVGEAGPSMPMYLCVYPKPLHQPTRPFSHREGQRW